VAAVFVVAVGAGGLVGWAAGVWWLKDPIGGRVPMVPNTALMLVLSGVSLGLSVGSPRRRWIARGVALSSAAVALATLLQDALHRDFGIDTLLSDAHPARPSVPAATALLLSNIALLLLDVRTRRGPTPAQLIATATAIIGWLAFGGHLFGTADFYVWSSDPHVHGMPIQLSAGLVALGLGIIVARPESGAMATFTSRHVGGRVARTMLLIALSIPALAYLAIRGANAGWYPPPGASIVEGVAGMVASVAITLVVAGSLDRSDARRRRTEAESRVFQALVENSSDFIGIADPNGKAVYVNPAGRRLVGMPPTQSVEETDRMDYYPPDVRPFAADVIARGMAERGRWSGEIQFRNWQTEGRIPVSYTRFTILDSETGNVLGAGTITRDISELKRAREELARAGREQKFLAEAGVVLGSTLDRSEILAHAARLAVRDVADVGIVDLPASDGQPAALKVLSSDPAEQRLCEVIEKRDHTGFARSLLETDEPALMPELPPEYLESIASDPEQFGALRALHLGSAMAAPMRVGDRVLGTLLFARSRTSHRYEERDLFMAEELARRVALSLENARLYQAAQLATQARDKVLGVVAHDLRNPASAVVMNAGLLRRRADDPEQTRARADTIERAANRMIRLIQDLLDVRRMEAGELSIDAKRTRVGDVVRDAVEVTRGAAGSASLELRVELAEGLPDVWADRDRLLQVLENLLSNAIKFTGPGGHVVIGAAPHGNDVLFRVTDSGVGIEPKDIPHLFDPFWQARKTDRRGAGLGLPIVKGIVESHRGRIWVESTPNRGSTFSFVIPRNASAEERRPEAAHG
jgi:PAS domain S-box-containing protein